MDLAVTVLLFNHIWCHLGLWSWADGIYSPSSFKGKKLIDQSKSSLQLNQMRWSHKWNWSRGNTGFGQSAVTKTMPSFEQVFLIFWLRILLLRIYSSLPFLIRTQTKDWKTSVYILEAFYSSVSLVKILYFPYIWCKHWNWYPFCQWEEKKALWLLTDEH